MSKLIIDNPSKKLRVLKYSLLASISVGSIVAVPLEGAASSNKSASLESLNREEHFKSINTDSYIERQRNRPKRSQSLGRSLSIRKAPLRSFNGQEAVKNSYTPDSTNITGKSVVTINYNIAPQNHNENTIPIGLNSLQQPSSSDDSGNKTFESSTPVPKPMIPASGYEKTIAPINEDAQKKVDKLKAAIKNESDKKVKKSLEKTEKEISKAKNTLVHFVTKEKIELDKITKINKENKELREQNNGVKSDNKRVENELKIVKNNEKLEKHHSKLANYVKNAEKIKDKIENSFKKLNLNVGQEEILASNSKESLVQELNTSFVPQHFSTPRRPAPVATGSVTLVAQKKLSFEDTINTQPTLTTPLQAQQEKINGAREEVFNKNKSSGDEVRSDSLNNHKLINQNQQTSGNTAKTSNTTRKQQKQRAKAEKARKAQNKENDEKKDIKNIRYDILKKMQQITNKNKELNQQLQDCETKIPNIQDKAQKKSAEKQLSLIKQQVKGRELARNEAEKVAEKAKEEKSRKKLKTQQKQMEGYIATVQNSKIETDIKNLEILVPNPPAPPSISNIPSLKSNVANGGAKIPLTPFVAKNQQLNPTYDEDGYLAPSPKYTPESTEKLFEHLAYLAEKRTALEQTSSPSKQQLKQLKAIKRDQSDITEIHQQLQQILIHKPENIKTYAKTTEAKLNDIIKRKDNYSNIETDQDVGFESNWNKNYTYNTQAIRLLDLKALEVLGYRDINDTLYRVNRADSVQRPISFHNLLKDLEEKKKTVKVELEQANLYAENNPHDTEAKKQIVLRERLLKQYDTDIKLIKEASENNKNENRKANNVHKLLEHLDLAVEKKLAPLREYDALDKDLQKVAESKKMKEEEYFTARDQNVSDSTLDILALEALNLSIEQSNLEQVKNNLDKNFQSEPIILENPVIDTHKVDISLVERNLKALIIDIEKDPKENLACLDLEYTNEAQKQKENQYITILNENSNDPRLENLAIEALNLSIKKLDLEQKIQALRNEDAQNNSVSPQIIVTLPNGETLQEPIYATVNKDTKRATIETNEEKSKTSTPKQQLTPADSVKSISELLDSNEDLSKAENRFDELWNSQTPEPESTVSDERGKLPFNDEPNTAISAGDEELSDENDESSISTEIAEASGVSYSLLSSSDELTSLQLKDNREEESDNDSGIEEEVEELSDLEVSDSEEEQLKAINTAIHEEAVKEVVKSIAETPITTNHSNKVVTMVKNDILTTRLDTTMAIKSNEAAVASGDEEESHIQRGIWVRGMYGTNNQGRVNNINGYKGINKGGTIGFDVEIDNNVIGIAYSNVRSVFKFKNNKNNDKEFINSHVISIYGQKELPKNFAVQALVAASRNFIKDKTTYSLGDAKFKSNVKHRNDSYNAEALLNYNHLTKSNVIITPNIGLRYGKSRDGIYNETGISVQEISLAMKENNIIAGILGTKVKIPLKDILKVNNLGLTLHGATEHNIKEKTQRVNRVVQIQGNKFTPNYVIPKQPKTSYNLGTGIVGNVKNTTISLEYNHYLNKHYRSHQGSIKLKVNL